MQFPQFTKDRTFTEQILSLERLRSEYQRCAGQDISDDLALSILVKCLPAAIRQHVQLQITEKHTYSDIKAFVQTYEMTTSTWSTSRVHSELGVVSTGCFRWSCTYGSRCGDVEGIWQRQIWQKMDVRARAKEKIKGKERNSQFNAKAKARARILPKENLTLLVVVAKAMDNHRSLIPISAFTATAMDIESFNAESFWQTRQLEM